MNGTPHRVVDGVVKSAVNTVEGLGSSLNGTARSLGGQIQDLTDTPFKLVGGLRSPLRVVDKMANGLLNTADNAINRGGLDSIKNVSEAVSSGLDEPVEQFGIPPALGNGFDLGGIGKKIQMPKMGRR